MGEQAFHEGVLDDDGLTVFKRKKRLASARG